jgi:hypothetical protein
LTDDRYVNISEKSILNSFLQRDSFTDYSDWTFWVPYYLHSKVEIDLLDNDGPVVSANTFLTVDRYHEL